MKTAFSKGDRLPFLLICLYAATELIPGSNTADVIGTQWFYLNIVNLISILFIAFSKDDIIKEAINRTGKTALYVIYLFLFILAAISVVWAINRIEGIVGIARWANMFIMFF